MWPKGYFDPFFLPLFGPRMATFGALSVWQMAQTGLPGSLHRFPNLVPTLSTQNRPPGPICVAKRLFKDNFGSFLAPVVGCVKKSEPQNLTIYLWFPTVLGPQDSEFFSKKI